VVLTNKGSNAVPVQITQDGVTLTNQFLKTFVTGSDPSAENDSPQNSPVQIQSTTATNAVTIPGYSVVRLEWTVFNVPQPVLGLVSSNSLHTVQWAGLTNVTYNVQGVTNLLNNTWPTLGKVSSARTNFNFTDPSTSSVGYYRLIIP
jgi:hypothetical protein